MSISPKQRAAEAAIAYLSSDSVVGLGTGSTADYFLTALAAALISGALRNIRGLPTSRQSEERARQLGIPLLTFADVERIDVTVDGADEISPQLNLIKGLGGALLREKIVAQNSKKQIIIADAGKEVAVLGTKGPLPVEVAMFAHEAQERFLRSLGCQPALRKMDSGDVYRTDNGNVIYDCKFGGIEDPASLDAKLKGRAGIVETGLFVGIASVALVADDHQVHVRQP